MSRKTTYVEELEIEFRGDQPALALAQMAQVIVSPLALQPLGSLALPQVQVQALPAPQAAAQPQVRKVTNG